MASTVAECARRRAASSAPVKLGSLEGKLVMLSVVPSIDTRVCETQTHKISDAILGRAFGPDVKETGLLARSVWVIGADGKISYRELVANQGTEPDYDALVAAVKRAAAS